MKALITEDNECIRELLQLFLNQKGFDTDVAENGHVAFRMIQETDYALIISDIDMPEVNGRELYYLILRYAPHLIKRIIFSTAHIYDSDYKTFFQSVPCPVLFKPYSLYDLEAVIDTMIARPCKQAAS